VTIYKNSYERGSYMTEDYTTTSEYWDEIFDATPLYDPSNKLPYESLEASIKWVADGSKNVLDFGCGNGKVTLRSLSYGTQKVYGIDLSSSAIDVANKVSKANNLQGKAEFHSGSLDKLIEFDDCSLDSVILYNIVDNLTPQDGKALLEEIHRIVSPNGKILIKLNPLLTNEQIVEYELESIEGNFFKEPSGIYLWNQTNDEWKSLFERYFTVEKYEEILFPEYEMTNRMFYLRNR
jgi:ubiquinone/menaquinone biosynthesis C-methylase UbiE